MRKSHFNDEFLVLMGPIISRLFTCSNAEKNKIKKQRVLALVLSLCVYHNLSTIVIMKSYNSPILITAPLVYCFYDFYNAVSYSKIFFMESLFDYQSVSCYINIYGCYCKSCQVQQFLWPHSFSTVACTINFS